LLSDKAEFCGLINDPAPDRFAEKRANYLDLAAAKRVNARVTF